MKRGAGRDTGRRGREIQFAHLRLQTGIVHSRKLHRELLFVVHCDFPADRPGQRVGAQVPRKRRAWKSPKIEHSQQQSKDSGGNAAMDEHLAPVRKCWWVKASLFVAPSSVLAQSSERNQLLRAK